MFGDALSGLILPLITSVHIPEKSSQTFSSEVTLYSCHGTFSYGEEGKRVAQAVNVRVGSLRASNYHSDSCCNCAAQYLSVRTMAYLQGSALNCLLVLSFSG